MDQLSENRSWLRPAFALVVTITALRWVMLAFDRTDLFVDEAQYWLWGKEFAFGYFSKPPLIAWVIGLVTWVTGSDAAFWVRMPAAAFHGATALIVGGLAARIYGPRLALWVVATYLTLPMAAVGSLLISTDTVMAPFFAAALYFYHRLLTDGRAQDAALAGLCIGVACLAKYAGVYFLVGAALGAVLHRDFRPQLGHVALMLLVWAALVAPNILWNLTHGLSTLAHTADNIGWIEHAAKLDDIGADGLIAFWIGQIGVVGPVILAAFVIALLGPVVDRSLVVFALPALSIVSGQAFLDSAYANWAITAYFTGVILAAAVLAQVRWLRWASLTFNGVICVLLPVLTVFPTFGIADLPLLYRYIGRADLSHQIIAIAEQAHGVPVVSASRDILADLYYTGRDTGLAYYAPQPQGRAENHYQDRYPLPVTVTGPVLLIATEPPACPYSKIPLSTAGGAYEKASFAAYLIDASCLSMPAMPPVDIPRDSP